MTTYSKETALFDTGAIATDINEAGQTADRYITYVDAETGIQVHNAEDDDNYVQINSDGMEVYRDDASVATFGTEARIGPLNDAEKVVIGSGGVSMYTAENAEYFKSYVDDVNLKTVQVNYGLDPMVISSGSGTTSFSTSFEYVVPGDDVISAADWAAVSAGDEFSVVFRVIGSGTKTEKIYTIKLTKGTAKSIHETYTYTTSSGTHTIEINISYTTSGGVEAISFTGSGSCTYSKPWNAYIKLSNIIYPKHVPAPTVEIDGDLIVDSINVGDALREDYVVEQGTSGNWGYTKWNSGKLEQWYVGNPGSYTVGTTRGQLRSGGTITYTYPVAFVSDPCVTVDATLTTDAYVVWAQASSHSLTSIGVRIVASANISANSNYAIHIHAVGKWK